MQVHCSVVALSDHASLAQSNWCNGTLLYAQLIELSAWVVGAFSIVQIAGVLVLASTMVAVTGPLG